MSEELKPILTPLFNELHGERVIVRPYRESDAPEVYRVIAASRDHLRPWLAFADEHQTIDETRDWIIHSMSEWLLRTALNVGVWERGSERFLGGSGFYPRNWPGRYFEVGYWLDAAATGQGYMTEAASLIVEYLFIQLDANRVEIRCDEKNLASASVARRLGFVHEACLRNEGLTPGGLLRNTLVFSMTPEDRKGR
jgi:RimJ/RimL family protein N-acetyltransferase